MSGRHVRRRGSRTTTAELYKIPGVSAAHVRASLPSGPDVPSELPRARPRRGGTLVRAGVRPSQHPVEHGAGRSRQPDRLLDVHADPRRARWTRSIPRGSSRTACSSTRRSTSRTSRGSGGASTVCSTSTARCGARHPAGGQPRRGRDRRRAAHRARLQHADVLHRARRRPACATSSSHRFRCTIDPADGGGLVARPACAPTTRSTIEFTSHHTILTDQPERAVKPLRRRLGGQVIHTCVVTRSGARRAPTSGSRTRSSSSRFPTRARRRSTTGSRTAPKDSYHAITFKVADLDQVRRHLAAVGVGLRSDTEHVRGDRSEDEHGRPWGFTSEPIPGDERS